MIREHLQAISPLNHVERITRPLYIAQGYNDPRVPASESEQIYRALKTADIPVWYVIALDEGHGFRKKINRDYDREATFTFVKEILFE
jgi:dipeptidyl aminopeptidase/acylaminoacyl peptidase